MRVLRIIAFILIAQAFVSMVYMHFVWPRMPTQPPDGWRQRKTERWDKLDLCIVSGALGMLALASIWERMNRPATRRLGGSSTTQDDRAGRQSLTDAPSENSGFA
jgi:hypothetical protein